MLKFTPLLITLLLTTQATAINIKFDYTHDTQGFFQDPLKRQALQTAGNIFTQFQDNLTPINPQNQNNYDITFTKPDGSGSTTIQNLQIQENEIIIYVGGWNFHPSVLGWANNGQISDIQGSQEFKDNINARGQQGALLDTPTDYATWGGVITFNKSINWHFNTNTNPEQDQQDFLTTATHEIGHILGFGEAPSWLAQITEENQNYIFNGQASIIANNNTPPKLDSYGSHWAPNTQSTYLNQPQETAMDPSTPKGQRQYLTQLDYAGFHDIGWQIPEPSSLFILLALTTPLIKRK